MKPDVCREKPLFATGSWCEQCDEQDTCSTQIELAELAKAQRRDVIRQLKSIMKGSDKR